MNAYEYFVKQREKSERSREAAIARQAPEEDIKNLERKVGFFDEAIEALGMMKKTTDDLK